MNGSPDEKLAAGLKVQGGCIVHSVTATPGHGDFSTQQGIFLEGVVDSGNMLPSDRTVLTLVFCLIFLILLLVFLYKKLNREADGEFTIRRLVYKEGGVRDRVRSVVSALEDRLGVQLWRRSDAEEDGEEMQEIKDEEAQVKECHGSDGQDEGNEEERREERKTGSNTSDVSLSLENSEDRSEVNRGMEEREEEREERDTEDDEASERRAFLIDLRQLSGDAMWSEGEGVTCDVTPL